MCGEEDIGFYRSVRISLNAAIEPVAVFYAQLRAAVICRMHRLMEAAMSNVLAGEKLWSGAAIRVCLDRMLAAASASDFRGGTGIRFDAPNQDNE